MWQVIPSLMPYILMYFRVRWYALKCVWACREMLLARDFFKFGFETDNRWQHAIEVWKSGKLFHERNEIAILMGKKKRNV